MNKKFLIGLVLVTALLFFAVYLGNVQKQRQLSEAGFSNPTQTPTINPTVPQEMEAEIPDDWKKYESSKLGVLLYYPPKMQVTENPDSTVRFLLIGPSQSLGTEMYDGIILTFLKGNYEGGSLKQFVEEEIEKKKKDEIYIEVGNLEEVKIGNRSGYKCTESALGEFAIIYLPTSGRSYINISYLLEDPKNQGFTEILDTIFKSLEIKL